VSLTLNTLGRLEILWDGQPASELSLRKSQALLIYLALNPGSHDRSHLAGLLWGDLPEDNARRNLRHALHQLRHGLNPEILDGDRLSVGLDPDIFIQVDALDLEAAIARAGRCRREENPTATAGYLEAAADLYQGDFLSGFDVADCLEFEEWVTRRRARMREQILDTLDILVTHWTHRGAYERALGYARRLLALEPLRETSHRQMMTLLALIGQRSAALAQYQECRRVLEAELGLEPLEETEALYARLVKWEPGELMDGPLRTPTFPSEAVLANLPFTGRGDEHAALVRCWETSRRNATKLTLVEGEAGVGKTRLVEEGIRYAESQGAMVLRGRCYEFGGGLPYQPIAEALRGYLHAKETQIFSPTPRPSTLSPIWLAELSRLLPDLYRLFPDLPEAHAITGEAARQRLFEAVARFLQAIGDLSPASCLFLDDLHWADQSTLDLLHYLVRQLEGAPIWIVGTYRPEEVSLSHPLTRLRQGLSRDHRVECLALGPLSDESVRALARSLVGEQDGDALGDFLYHESEGNPFILMETISDLHELGALGVGSAGPLRPEVVHEDGHLIWTGSQAKETLPTSVQDIILQRVGRLSEPAQKLLTLAAVVGQPFDAALLCTAAGRDPTAVEASLDEWLTRHLIQQLPTSNLQYDFSHNKIRAAVYRAIGPGRRPGLHRRVGEALERVFSDQIDEQAGLLAYHWEQTAKPERAMAYLLRAGDQARLVYAHQEAVNYYRRALAILERQGNARSERAARTLMKLGQAYHGAFDYRHARQTYEEGFALWQQVGKIRSTDSLPPAPHPLRLRWLEPTMLDPTMSPDNHTSSVMAQLFSGLVTSSPEMDILPDVARTWEISEDGHRYVFHLRADARWSDGTPVTAGDFEYAWKRTLAPDTGSPAAGFLHDIKGARAFRQGQVDLESIGVRATNETTLVVELEEPAGYFLQLLVRPDYFPVPRHVVEAHGAAWTDPGNLITNGPFRLEAWRRGEVLVLARNPDYHGHFQGNVQRVELFPLTDWSARLQMYEDDALEVLGITFFPSAKRELARQRYAGEYVSRPVLETCFLVFDANGPPFDDVRVRRAFALATDRETLAEEVLQGYATAATGGLLPQGMPGHSPDIGLPYDPEQAQRLLAEAGYPGGRGFPAVDTLAPRVVEARVTYLQSQWREILGVEVAWQTPEWATFLDQLNNERHHLFCAMWVADYPDPDNFLRVSRTETWAGWQNERYDRLVGEARRVMEQEERMKRYRQAEEILVAEAPILPLTYEREHLLIKPWISYYPTTASRAVFWKDVVIAPRA
jgi:ABC-type oligopeptide transport system substrate-binding subunit/DNA-binding SARP family transcriptional activator